VAVRENLALAKEWNSGNGRSEDDAVVDQVPEVQDALEVRLGSRLRYSCVVNGGHVFAGEYMRKRKDGKAILSD
jgi:hypothetical protein